MSNIFSNASLACFLIVIASLGSANAGDVQKGKAVFEKCAACHSLYANKNDDAPTLAGIFGRKAAAVEEFRYSVAMKQSNVTWDERTLNAFIEDPQGFIPGNRMAFDGLKDKPDREDLLAYLKQASKNSDSARLQSRIIVQQMDSKETPMKNMHANAASEFRPVAAVPRKYSGEGKILALFEHVSIN